MTRGFKKTSAVIVAALLCGGSLGAARVTRNAPVPPAVANFDPFNVNAPHRGAVTPSPANSSVVVVSAKAVEPSRKRPPRSKSRRPPRDRRNNGPDSPDDNDNGYGND